MSNNSPTNRLALSPYGEERVKAHIADITKLPTFKDAVAALREQIQNEQPQDIDVVFTHFDMDDEAFLRNKNTNQIFKYTKHSLNQLVGRVKPEGVIGMGGYLAACPPELRAVNYNYWHEQTYFGLTDQDKKNHATLRTREDGDIRLVRGIVSRSYVPVDDLPILTQLSELLPVGAHMRSARGDLRSRYDIIWPTTKPNVNVNDTLNVAVHLVNSETGVSSLKMEPMVFLANSLGAMILPTRDSDVIIRHVGEAKRKLMVALGKTMSLIGPFIQSLGAARQDPVGELTQDIDKLFTALGKHFEFSASKVAQIKAEFHALNDLTRAGVATAISKAANTFDVETGEELQRAAGQLVSSGWGSIRSLVKEQ